MANPVARSQQLLYGLLQRQKAFFGAFFDVTSLYVRTMQQMLPLDQYAWNDAMSFSQIVQINDDSPVGYFVEVELEYPSSLNDGHNNLPLAPEKLTIKQSWLPSFRKVLVLKFHQFHQMVQRT